MITHRAWPISIGLLIGLYPAAGVIVAIPGGAIAARFGDKRVVSLSTVLMLIGGALVSWGPNWEWLIAGRLLASAGWVIMNIVMTKTLVDWFVGREISTAMGIFITSWPAGIALVPLVLPAPAATGGLELAWAAVLRRIAVGLILFGLVYRAPAQAVSAETGIRVHWLPAFGLFLSGMIRARYNAALAMVFSFGPALLNQRRRALTTPVRRPACHDRHNDFRTVRRPAGRPDRAPRYRHHDQPAELCLIAASGTVHAALGGSGDLGSRGTGVRSGRGSDRDIALSDPPAGGPRLRNGYLPFDLPR